MNRIARSGPGSLSAFAICIGLIIILFGSGVTSAQILDPSFTGRINNAGIVYDTAVQADGKIVLVGDFTFANGQGRNRIVRVNADGSLDTTFNARADATVYTVYLQADGKILIGGSFTNVNGVARGRIARLNADGSLDTSFDTSTGAASGIIYNAMQLAGGKVVVSGSFTTINGTALNRIARLNADGTLDSTFTPGTAASGVVYDFDVQADGKLVIGGSFTTYNDTASARIARLNTDGTLDTTYSVGTGASSTVYDIDLQTDGKAVISGGFATINGTARTRIARLNSDGSVDTGFDVAGISTGIIYAVEIEADGDIVFGGTFTAIGGNPYVRLARASSAGVLDTTFTPAAENTVRALSVQTDQKIIVGGAFINVTSVSKAGSARLNSNGSVDTAFAANVFDNATVRAVAQQPDGKILAAGIFDFANFVPRMGIARFNADGTLDTAFAASGIGADSTVFNVAVQADGKIVIVGTFDTYNGAAQPGVARLNTDGTLDSSFAPVIASTSTVNALAIQPDGKILIGGTFTSVNATAMNRIARLNSDGTLDSSFVIGTGASSTIQDIRLMADGKIYIGGSFTTFNGFAAGRIARLLPTGAPDTAFDPGVGASSTVYSIAVTGDGVYIGGAFTTVKTEPRVRVAKLTLNGSVDSSFNPGSGADGTVYTVRVQTDGKVLIAGFFDVVAGVTRNRIARLNATGTLDGYFNAGLGADGTIYELTRLADGKYMIGGIFANYAGVPSSGLAQIIMVRIRTRADFDGDGRSDLSLFRPADGNWWIDRSTDGLAVLQWGLGTDVLSPEDYDGDGRTDIAVWRSGDAATFYILRSSDGGARIEQFGQTGDIPISADFDGDGLADVAVYRPGSQSYFYYRGSRDNPNGNITFIPWGQTGDIPVRGDYDGDGKNDPAVFRPSTRDWIIRKSSDGQAMVPRWGLSTDVLAPADYDGDGKTDIAVFRDGVWYILYSADNQVKISSFGTTGDLPVPADYDGDGRVDIAIYRNGTWWIDRSLSGTVAIPFGTGSDKPVPNEYLP